MARGWESKSVELQIDSARDSKADLNIASERTVADAEVQRKRQSLLLSRTRVQRELQSIRNPNHQQTLERALEHLEKQLKELDSADTTSPGSKAGATSIH